MVDRVDRDRVDDFDPHASRFPAVSASFPVQPDGLARTWTPTVRVAAGGALVDAVHALPEPRRGRHPILAVVDVPDHRGLPVSVFEDHERRGPRCLEVGEHHEAYRDRQSPAQHVREPFLQAPSIGKVQPLGSATTWA